MNPGIGKVIVNVTPTGMVPTRQMSPHVPLAPEEIVADVAACRAEGASMVHLHARDEAGTPTYRKEVYARIIGPLRERHPDLVLVVSTSGRNFGAFEQRSEALELEGDLRPDMGSLTLASLNFPRSASVNSPDMVQRLAGRMGELGIKPELEVFDLGMVNYAHYLIRKGLLQPPYYFNLILGNVASAQARMQHLGLLVSELPEGSVWCVGGIGEAQLAMNAAGLLWGHGVRVGLEDNLYLDAERQEPARNVDLVARVVRLARELRRGIATPAEVRSSLGVAAAKGAPV